MGLLIPMFYASGGHCSEFQSQCDSLVCMRQHLATLSATSADLLAVNIAADSLPTYFSKLYV